MAVLEAVTLAAHQTGISFFVVGAKARDMILYHAYKQPIRRRTGDIDIAVRVATWGEFEQIVQVLTLGGRFTRTGRPHRFMFDGLVMVDIVPFGPIAGDMQEIAWPPTEDTVMNVLVFDDAFDSAVRILLRREPQLEVLVAALAGLAVMKLVSWDDQYPGRTRDAVDSYYIAESYTDAGNDERFYHDAADLMEVEKFDYVSAGARLLGRDMARIAAEATRQKVRTILDRETDQLGSLKLVSDIIRERPSLQETSEVVLGLLESVRMGFNEGAS